MPIYEYRCDSCGAKREALQKISDAPLVDCQACGEPSLRKLMSAAGFRLKGGGWYETDFKNSDRKKNLAGDKDKRVEKPSDGNGSKGKAETNGAGKSAEKSESKGSKPAASADRPPGGKSAGANPA